MRAVIRSTALFVTCLVPVVSGSQQPATSTAPAASQPATPAADSLPPLPPEKSVSQTVQVAGRTLNYTATIGTLPIVAV